MIKASRISVNAKWAVSLTCALLACMLWVSIAHAQSAPFNSQYDPPPTTPPGCGNDDDGSGNSGSGNSGSGNSGSGNSGVAGDFDPGVSGSSSESAGSGDSDPGANSGSESQQVLSETEDPNWGCEPGEVSEGVASISALPTTGGIFIVPILLGAAVVSGAGIMVVRRKR